MRQTELKTTQANGLMEKLQRKYTREINYKMMMMMIDDDDDDDDDNNNNNNNNSDNNDDDDNNNNNNKSKKMYVDEETYKRGPQLSSKFNSKKERNIP